MKNKFTLSILGMLFAVLMLPVLSKGQCPDGLSATSSVISPILCNGANTGSAEATPSGGISPYTFLWSSGGGTNSIINSYSLAATQTFSYAVSIQTFTVPAGVTQVSITVVGGAGGEGGDGVGGNGASFAEITSVTSGHVLGIVTGGLGGNGSGPDIGGGGGGGSYVWDENTTTLLAVAAGGGGGGDSYSGAGAGTDLIGNSTTNGTSNATGGTGGAGGGAGTGGTPGAGGAGWLSDGGSIPGANGLGGAIGGGNDEADGFTGGGGYGGTDYNINGGYGGGGGSGFAGGGGGGYNGGGGGNGSSYGGGGGGGSYYNTTYGTVPGSVTATNTGNGSVVISYSVISNGGIVAGTYSLTVTDANGCTTTTSVTLTQPTALSAIASATANVTCLGASTGSVSVTASHGTTPYTYSWSGGGGTNSTANGLIAGTYTVTVHDSCGALVTASAVITQPAALTTTASVTANVTCNNGSNGNASATPSGGTIPYTYSWSDGVTTGPTGAVLTAGTYTVTVQDNCGNSATASATITQPAELQTTASATANACNGSSNGNASASPSGGTSPYTYSWSNGSSTVSTSNPAGAILSAGTYTVTVTDHCGVSVTASVTINQSPLMTPTPIVTSSIICEGGLGDGAVEVSGGVSPYTYSWSSGGASSSTISSFSISGATTYTYTGAIRTFTVPAGVSQISVTVDGAQGGSGSNNGTIAGGAGAGFTGIVHVTAGHILGIVAGGTGTNSVSGTDNAGGGGGGTYVWDENTTTLLAAAGGGGGGGFTTASAGGTNLTTNVTTSSTLSNGGNGAGGLNGNGGAGGSTNVNNASGAGGAGWLSAGSSAGGSGSPASGGSSFPTFTGGAGSSSGKVGGFGGGGGSGSVGGGGGGGYNGGGGGNAQYSISPYTGAGGGGGGSYFNTAYGTLSGSVTANHTGNGQAIISYSASGNAGVPAGTYTVTITDNHGCSTTATVTITQPAVALTATSSLITNACFGINNGSASVTASGGISPYTYSWSNGVTTSATGAILSGGTYTVTVTDFNTCSVTASVVVTQPSATLSVTGSASANACNGTNNGSALATPSGGSIPYTYSWSTGSTTNPTTSTLSPGTYTVTVTDRCGNTATATATINQSNPITPTASVVTPITCYGATNGSAAVGVSGGTTPYAYSWSGGGTNDTITSYTISGTQTFTIVGAIQTFTVPAGVTQLSIAITGAKGGQGGGGTTTRQAGGDGAGFTGIAKVTPGHVLGIVTGGLGVNGGGGGGGGGGTYVWDENTTTLLVVAGGGGGGGYGSGNTNVSGGSGGTNLTSGVSINSPGGSNGAGGTGGNGGSVPNAAGNGGGGAGWLSGGASVTASGNLAGGGNPYPTFTGGTGTSGVNGGYGGGGSGTSGNSGGGGGGYNGGGGGTGGTGGGGGGGSYLNMAYGSLSGSETATNTGNGSATITYSATYSSGGVAAGTYSVTVTDANGCTATASVTLTEPTILSTTGTTVLSNACTGSSTGNAMITIAGGTSPYTYSWSNGTTNNPTGAILTAGTYTVTVHDNCNASVSASVIISQPPVLSTTAPVTANVTCNGGNNGSASAIPSGGAPPYTYSWSGGGTNSSVSGLIAGTYTITIQDACGTTATASANITQPNAVSTGISSTNACNGSSNGTATANPSNGTLPYTYSWSGGGNNSTVGGLSEGTYSLTVTDNCGQTASASVSIQSSSLMTATTSVITPIVCIGGNNGTADVEVTGGTSPYAYSWSSGGGTNATINSYSVVGAPQTFAYNGSAAGTNGSGTIQTFTVPAGITQLSITITGAAGGQGDGTSGGGGGPGASFTGLVTVTPTHVLGIVVGGMGVGVSDDGGAGGGGSFVWDESNTTLPLAVAGGGGGAYYEVTGGGAGGTNLTTNATTTAAGADGQGAGGTGGHGGAAGGTDALTYGDGAGSGGAGWLSNGGSITGGTYATTGGSAYPSFNGGAGNATGQYGGYGGGGGGSYAAGSGGGGYNGGAGGYGGADDGGGGGSYLNGTVIGTPTATNTGNGSVVITYGGVSNTGIIAGTYTVTVTDANGCTTTASVTLTQPGVLRDSIIIASTVNISCNGGSNGSATVGVKYGTSPYTYSWSGGGGNSATAGGLTVGTYTVTVQDNCGASATTSVTLASPTALTVSASITSSNLCSGGGNGAAQAYPSGGGGIYTYSWSNGITTAATGNVLSGGTYSVTVSDKCGASASASVVMAAGGLRDSIIAASVVNTACYGGATGNATVGVKGGVSPYTYSWSDGGGTNALINSYGISGTQTFSYQPAIQNFTVPAGVTQITVTIAGAQGGGTTNAIGYGASFTGVVTVTPTHTLSIAVGGAGTKVTASSGGGGGSYVWDQNSTTLLVVAAGGGGNDISNAGGGAGGTNLSTNATTTGNPSNGGIDLPGGTGGNGGVGGTLGASPGGGGAGWYSNGINSTVSGGGSGGNDMANGGAGGTSGGGYGGGGGGAGDGGGGGGGYNGGGGGNQETSGGGGGSYFNTAYGSLPTTVTATHTGNGSVTISYSFGSPTGLIAGTYSVTVTDANGCTATARVNINQPTAIVPTASATANVSCNGSSNGQAKVSVSGGTPPYSYSWAPDNSSTYIANGLSVGTYTVTVTDHNGCSGTSSATVNQPVALRDSLATINYPLCTGGTGSATIGVTGGTSPYRYSWSPNVSTTATAAGLTVRSYVVQVKDNNGCYNNLNFSISQPAALRDSIVKSATVNVSCSGGSATVGVKYGTSPYTYSWSSGGGSNATATGLSAGTYTVTVSDAGSCTVTASVSIGQPSTLSATAFAGTNISCNGGSTGQAKVSVSGGTSPYIYSWSPGSNSTYIASGLSVGTYTVTVSDNCGASATSSVTLTQPSALSDSVATISYPLCTGGTGSATIGVSGGTSPYKYTWSPNVSTTASATGLTVRGYVVQVKDNNGCYNDINFSLTQPAALRDSIVKSATVNISCNGASAGSATAGVKYGTTPYTYSWSPAGGNSATAIGLSGGTYTVTVSDGGGCTVTASVNITQPAALSPTAFIGAGITCNGASNGTAKVSVSGGSIPYTYSWLSPASGSTYIASGLSAGTYTVTVSDNCGASASSSVTVTEPAILSDSVITSSVVSPPCSGGGTGSAAIGVTGGTSPYRYTWSPNVSTTATGTGLTVRGYVVQVKDNNGCYNDITFNVTCSSASETVTYNKENGASCCPSSDNINLYPNPNTGQFTLSGLQQGMILEMYDYTGKMISTMTTTNESMQLNILNQANGVYLIRILDKDGNLVSEKKVVKTQ